MSRPLIATVAKKLLSHAALRLGTADPNPDMHGYLDESLAIPLGEPTGERSRLLEPSFSETTPENLAFTVGGNPHMSAADRVQLSTQAVSDIVGSRFGKAAERWLDQHTELARSNAYNRSSTWGASFSGAFDRNG